MTNSISTDICNFLNSNSIDMRHSPVSLGVIKDAESRLKMSFPSLLSIIFNQIGNGGFGPGYGLIGISNGHKSDFGDIVETYFQLLGDWQKCGEVWPQHLLPFCEFGDNIFANVDILDRSNIWLSTDSKIYRMSYDLSGFFHNWMHGYKFLSDLPSKKRNDIVNPFS